MERNSEYCELVCLFLNLSIPLLTRSNQKVSPIQCQHLLSSFEFPGTQKWIDTQGMSHGRKPPGSRYQPPTTALSHIQTPKYCPGKQWLGPGCWYSACWLDNHLKSARPFKHGYVPFFWGMPPFLLGSCSRGSPSTVVPRILLVLAQSNS